MSDFLRPESLVQAAEMRASHRNYTVLAGGTDLLVAANHKPAPLGIIDLFGLRDLRGIERLADQSIRIGAATTYAEVLESELCRHALKSLWDCSREVGALQIQARGTLGGNIATSSPVGDTLPVWLALDAEIELVSTERGSRRVRYEEFCTGYRVTALADDELITAIIIPPEPRGMRQFWRKMGTRRAQSISKVMVAASAALDSDGAISHVRIGLGAVADRPVRARAAEKAALGQKPASIGSEIREALRSEITPIDDVCSSASYRLIAAENVVCRFFAGLGSTRGTSV